ncbi:hypothetical protein DJ73_19445 [Halorubrum sp. Ea1]|nr:hypothetical protein DJ73_19445 [Halorubrum sp. Ea1]
MTDGTAAGIYKQRRWRVPARPPRGRAARARESVVRSEAEDHRRGWGGVRCGAVRSGGAQRGSREDEARCSKHRSEGAPATERGAQQSARVVAAGALEVFIEELLATIYKRAAGALEVFIEELLATIYKRAAGALEVLSGGPRSTVYK